MKYNYKIIYEDTDGNPGMIGVLARDMLEAAHMAEAIREGMDECRQIKAVERVEDGS